MILQDHVNVIFYHNTIKIEEKKKSLLKYISQLNQYNPNLFSYSKIKLISF